MFVRLAVPVLVLAACSGRVVARTSAIPDPFAEAACGVSSESFGVRQARELDILFVIDNSETMADEQSRLLGQFDALMQALAAVPGGFPDSHIGVISTDLGTGAYSTEWCETIGGQAGRLQSGSGSCLEGSEGYISVPGGDDYLADVQDAFRCIAALGTGGCRFEQPLEAARLALTCDETTCINPGFLRPDSLLAVVFVGDEDDCSAANPTFFDPSQNSAGAALGYFSSYRCFEFGTVCDYPIERTGGLELTGCTPDEDGTWLHPVGSYYDSFTALRPPGRLLLAAITGPFEPGDVLHTQQTGGGPIVAPTCVTDTSAGFPALRMHDLIRRMGSDGLVLADHDGLGICGDNYAPALQRVGDAIRARVSAGCLSQALVREGDDGEPQLIDLPAQASCAVMETTPEQSQGRARCVFDGDEAFACPAPGTSPGALAPGSDSPCWYLCGTGPPEQGGCSHRWEVRFCRDAACSPDAPDPPETFVTAECLTCDLDGLCGNGVCDDQFGEWDTCFDDCE